VHGRLVLHSPRLGVRLHPDDLSRVTRAALLFHTSFGHDCTRRANAGTPTRCC
jgi:hypothetical protein